MRELDTDYLVIGAGASGMAFVDSLLDHGDADVVLVDRRHRPGGHWLDAYPFVRLHQTSANYGVNSRMLGSNRIDVTGPNAGFYERATAGEICDYYQRVLEERFLPSGRVRFLPMADHRGEDADGHHVVSLLDGTDTIVRVRRKIVDATYVQSEIPSRHTPSFAVDDGVTFLPPNDLVHLGEAARGFTVLGGGKTAVDTICWLLDTGVDPGAIRWIKPRDSWVFNRAFTQPLTLLASSYLRLQASWLGAAAEAADGADFARRLAAEGVFLRVDERVEPTMFRGSTISERELEQVRQVDDVVRLGRVRRIGTDEVVLDEGTAAGRGRVHVDCTANGVRATVPRPIFEPDRVVLQYVTVGVIPWSASTVGFVEATRDDDADKNRLCPPVVFSGWSADLLDVVHAGLTGMLARGAEPDIAAWGDAARVNPAAGTARRRAEPEIATGAAAIAANIAPALANLDRVRRAAAPV